MAHFWYSFKHFNSIQLGIAIATLSRWCQCNVIFLVLYRLLKHSNESTLFLFINRNFWQMVICTKTMSPHILPLTIPLISRFVFGFQNVCDVIYTMIYCTYDVVYGQPIVLSSSPCFSSPFYSPSFRHCFDLVVLVWLFAL